MKKLLLLFTLIFLSSCESNEEVEPPCIENYECATVIERSGYNRRRRGGYWEYSFKYQVKFDCNDYVVEFKDQWSWYTSSANGGPQPGEQICSIHLKQYYPPDND